MNMYAAQSMRHRWSMVQPREQRVARLNTHTHTHTYTHTHTHSHVLLLFSCLLTCPWMLC